MSEYTIYHNPRCSKSRAALEFLEAQGETPQVVKYLETPLSASRLRALIKLLGISPLELVRKNEDLYKQRYAGKTLTDAQWIEAMVSHPVLIERPIVVRAVRGERAVLARPTEKIEQLLDPQS